MPHTSSSLGNTIRERRVSLGLTQEQLAELISDEDEYVRQSEISRIEAGRVRLPRRSRLERLANVLGLSLVDLLMSSDWADDSEIQAELAAPSPDSTTATSSVPETIEEPVAPLDHPEWSEPSTPSSVETALAAGHPRKRTDGAGESSPLIQREEVNTLFAENTRRYEENRRRFEESQARFRSRSGPAVPEPVRNDPKP